MNLHPRALLALILLLSVVSGPDALAQGRKAKRAGARRPPPAAAATSAEDARAAPHVEEGLRLGEAGDWEGAVKAFREAVAVSPRHPEAHVHLADAYMAAGRYEDAFAAYREAVRVAPRNPEAHHGLGAAYNDMAQYGDAFKHFVQAIRLDPNFAEAYYGIGFAYQRLDNWREALVYLRSALRLRPDYPEARLSLGLTYVGLGDLKAAAEQLRLLEASDASLADALRRELRGAAAEPPAPAAAQTQPPAPAAAPRERPAPTPAAAETAAAQTPTAAAPTPRPLPTPRPRRQPAAAESARVGSRRVGESKRQDEPGREDEARRVVEAASAPPPSGAVAFAVELAFWESIKDSAEPEEFAAYLKRYPQGQFSDLARIRQRALEARRRQAAPPRPPTLEETLEWLRNNFANRFTYRYTVRGEGASAAPSTHEANISYEPVLFEGCKLEWRDASDTLSVALSDLDPQGLRVERRVEPHTTFASEVWNVVVTATGGARAFRKLKGDGAGVINNYHAVTLQFASRERAEGVAERLLHAVKLCGGRPSP